ncbi:hypothetical protein V5S96_11095 [Corynebacterium mastitidis]|uniref:DUF2335 domain-containing protein n=1 Tax=Corynebacterium mastitidis TaxID=161890 RepID=A0ABU8P3J9_9CORY
MSNEHTHDEPSTEAPDHSHTPLGQDHLRGQDPRPSGERPQSLGTNRQPSPTSSHSVLPDEALDPEILQEVTNQVEGALLMQARSAPLPSPQELALYGEIDSLIIGKIVDMAVDSNRAANAATQSEANVNNAIAARISAEATSIGRGQWLFAVLSAFFVVIGASLVLANKDLLGIALVIVGGISTLGVLIQPKISERWTTLEDKNQQQ